MLHYNPTPILELSDPLFNQADVRVFVKREDMNHPFVSGNKWWKLKYNLEEANKLNKRTLLTFGGAYSNHLYATAAAASEMGLKSIGIIRGEETLPLNKTLSFVKRNGMRIDYCSREAYRSKTDPEFIEHLHHQFGDFYLIPEGGTNPLAVKGVAEFAQTLDTMCKYVCCAVGTGGTLAGLIQGLGADKTIVGLPVLKGGEFLQSEIERLLPRKFSNWKLIHDYHFGGYAKTNRTLLEFKMKFEKQFGFLLDPVYTAKALFGLYDLIVKGFFEKKSAILFIHTGGLQGNH